MQNSYANEKLKVCVNECTLERGNFYVRFPAVLIRNLEYRWRIVQTIHGL